ncbi:AMP-dependent synthetase/ligase [Actinorugispora endophytica]|uniref:Long-chain acyl-CoA synthetase n=1 Tax=Actinorugispora endophytica TaxID=1605990 RepID=A0A4R6UIQ6_9ACTN|nr:AMP-binding protein [Actinorugispora endophytica]TDQ46352.1 long-chain acyl-CoA synthetase [Actinorugispora endophytica]
MRQSRSPVSPLPSPGVLGELVYSSSRSADGERTAFHRPVAGDGWRDVGATEFLSAVTRLARGLIAAGVGRGDRVLVAAAAGYEQTLVTFGVWAAGGVVVWVPPGCSPGLLRRVLRDSRPAAAVVRSREHARVVASLQHELVDLGRTWQLDEAGLEGIAKPGAYMDASAVRFRVEECRPDDAAVICYTATPQRRVRGAVLTHRNLLVSGRALVGRLEPVLADMGEGRAVTLLGPGADGVAGYGVLVACMLGGVRVGFAREDADFAHQVREFSPTLLVADAPFLTRTYELERTRSKEGGWDGVQAFKAATQLAVEIDKKGRRGAWQRVSRALYEWAYTRVKDALGGGVRVVVCPQGGLEPRLTHFYGGAGVPVLEGFGLVQTGGFVTLNVPGAHRPGTVGPALDGVELRVSDSGEVMVRGVCVFAGYHNAARDTDRALRDGWLATGWLGEVDGEGRLVVRGPRRARPAAAARSAEPSPELPVAPTSAAVVAAASAAADVPAAAGAVVTGAVVDSGGEGVLPDFVALETRLLSHPLISQVIVLSENRPYATALITLKRDQLEYWRLVNGHPLSTPLEQIAFAPEMGAEIRRAVEEVNSSVSPESMIRAFHVLPEEFSPSSGLLLPSGRLRRDAVLRAFAEEIESLYAVPPTGERR